MLKKLSVILLTVILSAGINFPVFAQSFYSPTMSREEEAAYREELLWLAGFYNEGHVEVETQAQEDNEATNIPLTGIFYTVTSSDTYESITLHYYGDEKYSLELAAINSSIALETGNGSPLQIFIPDVLEDGTRRILYSVPAKETEEEVFGDIDNDGIDSALHDEAESIADGESTAQ